MFLNVFYDSYRYARYSTTIFLSPKSRLEGRLMANAHVIEKGLSFSKTRPFFGQIIISTLLKLMELFVSRGYETNNFSFQSSIRVLIDYELFHHKNNLKTPELSEQLKKYRKFLAKNTPKSVKVIDSKQIIKSAKGSYSDLVYSRHTVRNYSKKRISHKLIKKAVKLAIQTPSVCNRQSWKVYVYSKKTDIKKILQIQKGNRGFGHNIDTLLIVTSDLHTFHGFNERNQSFVDGGLFSMSLIYALHNLGIAICPLNWSVNIFEDIRIRKVVSISSSENIIVLLGLGHYPDKVSVTSSARKNPNEVLQVI